ncbi:hypothetical protein JJ685_05375 [Ramlibacter monticola]|uniref:Uncharacterized protein n=1 Tax=Ramlibacter monticola TaxID=1926872 RepID=A0A936YXV4_9BURK|nr:hypothetical protein [Ramlibacter monticola]MBL0390569.1 hypothetical protein [Ramlibacter monticola]
MLSALIYFGGSVPNLSSTDGGSEVDRRAIQLCWQDQARKSLEPSAARFVAATCEKLETEYMQKHGRRP